MQEQPIPPGLCQCGCGRPTTQILKSYAAKGLVRGEYRKFVHGHQRRLTGPDYEVDEATGCWVWLKNRNPGGYGRFAIDRVTHLAHRLYYERYVGPIPAGLVIDHLCRNPSCVNPDHLEPVTQRENVLRGESIPACKARQTHCKRGHELAGDNVYVSKKGHRDCRACHRIDQLAWNHARKAAA